MSIKNSTDSNFVCHRGTSYEPVCSSPLRQQSYSRSTLSTMPAVPQPQRIEYPPIVSIKDVCHHLWLMASLWDMNMLQSCYLELNRLPLYAQTYILNGDLSNKNLDRRSIDGLLGILELLQVDVKSVLSPSFFEMNLIDDDEDLENHLAQRIPNFLRALRNTLSLGSYFGEVDLATFHAIIRKNPQKALSELESICASFLKSWGYS